MQRLLLFSTLWVGFLVSACSAAPTDESLGGEQQALDNGSGGSDITTYAECIMGCVEAIDYCEKHQSAELNCAQKGEECVEYCDWAFPKSRVRPGKSSTAAGGALPKSSAAAAPGQSSLDGIATSPGASTLAFDIGGGISIGAGLQQCIPTRTCTFVCDPPQDPDDTFHCKLRCTYSCP